MNAFDPKSTIIPQPVTAKAGEGFFEFGPDTTLAVVGDDGALGGIANALALLLAPATGYDLKVGKPGKTSVVLRLDPQLPLGPEGYMLESSTSRIVITGNTARGVFYGVQTLRQLLPPQIESRTRVPGVDWIVPSIIVRDEPRFAWRGAMVDSARYLFSVDEMKRFIDLMALHKLNVFHWHLTDDQGWRIEIKKYPKLTEIGAWRAESPRRGDRKCGDSKRYGGFYSQEEIREIVAYASARFITVIPEIELPGHAAAAIAAYPELGNHDATGFAPMVQSSWDIKPYTYAPREETFRFLEEVLEEVMALFPSPYIHIGGDEAPKGQWKQSAFAQEIIKRHGLADEDELQSWFVHRIETFLNARGRKLVGWDEIQEGGLSPTATMMVWRDWKWARLALENGNPIVMSPITHCYLDYYQTQPNAETPVDLEAIGGFLPLDTVYSFDPVPPNLEPALEHLVLGMQGNLWTEYIWNYAKLEIMAFPRLSALAEIGWTPRANKDYASFLCRLRKLVKRFDVIGARYGEIPSPACADLPL